MTITQPTCNEVAEAADAVEHYRAVLEEDQMLLDKAGKSYSPMYRQIAQGRQVINVFDAIREGGVDFGHADELTAISFWGKRTGRPSRSTRRCSGRSNGRCARRIRRSETPLQGFVELRRRTWRQNDRPQRRGLFAPAVNGLGQAQRGRTDASPHQVHKIHYRTQWVLADSLLLFIERTSL